jgi:methylated-DNA-[protein]-cysteine S-methyltransferase
METVYIKTPLGIAAITGDVNGVSEITVLEEGEVSAQIPVFLRCSAATSRIFQFSKN